MIAASRIRHLTRFGGRSALRNLTTRTHIIDDTKQFNDTDILKTPHSATNNRRQTRIPSEEHAAFAFSQLASPGTAEIGLEEFVSTLQRIKLDFNLSRIELERVFSSLDTNGDGMLSLEEFKIGRTNSPFNEALINNLSGASGALEPDSWWSVPDNYDWRKSTDECYSAPLTIGFVGENISIRKSLDYSYHKSYSHERQIFQDRLIKSNVLLDGSGTDRPWLVFTCGPMGVGKGWVLGWMSANSILPLEHVSKIDPDAFKLRMPEWSVYQSQSMEAAGTQTHAESAYIAEIALRLAMKNSMNVWVDGSLRDWAWYQEDLKRIRAHFPQYRIAIVAVDASQEIISDNIQRRFEETGRHVPEKVQKDSTEAMDRGLRRLAPLVDLIAHVSNQRSEGQQHPTLKAVSLVDRSGEWGIIGKLTANK